jgi:hypothetical protein
MALYQTHRDHDRRYSEYHGGGLWFLLAALAAIVLFVAVYYPWSNTRVGTDMANNQPTAVQPVNPIPPNALRTETNGTDPDTRPTQAPIR